MSRAFLSPTALHPAPLPMPHASPWPAWFTLDVYVGYKASAFLGAIVVVGGMTLSIASKGDLAKLESKLEAQSTKQEGKQEQQITKLESKQEQQITKLESKLDAQSTKQEQQMKSLESKLDRDLESHNLLIGQSVAWRDMSMILLQQQGEWKAP